MKQIKFEMLPSDGRAAALDEWADACRARVSRKDSANASRGSFDPEENWPKA
jgi:hypothetical protein